MRILSLLSVFSLLVATDADFKTSPVCVAGTTCVGFGVTFTGILAAQEAFHSNHKNDATSDATKKPDATKKLGSPPALGEVSIMKQDDAQESKPTNTPKKHLKSTRLHFTRARKLVTPTGDTTLGINRRLLVSTATIGGDYLVGITLGSSAAVEVSVDLGSSNLGVPSKLWNSMDCSNCGEEVKSKCNAPKSDALSWKSVCPTGAQQQIPFGNCCQQIANTMGIYNSSTTTELGTGGYHGYDFPECYGTGGWLGLPVSDTVTFPSAGTFSGFKFARQDYNLCNGGFGQNPVYFGNNPGIMGLGFGSGSTVERLQQSGFKVGTIELAMCPSLTLSSDIAAPIGHLGFNEAANSFDMQLVEDSAELRFIELKFPSDGGYYQPYPLHWRINIPNGLPVKIPSPTSEQVASGIGPWIMDSGWGDSSNFPSKMYESIVAQLRKFSPQDVDKLVLGCIPVGDLVTPFSEWPIIYVAFKGTDGNPVEVPWHPSDYLINRGCTAGYVSFGFVPGGQYVWANQFLAQYIVVIKDLHAGSTPSVGLFPPSAAGRRETCGCVNGWRVPDEDVRSGCACHPGYKGSTCETPA